MWKTVFVLPVSFLIFIVVETVKLAFHACCANSPLCRGLTRPVFQLNPSKPLNCNLDDAQCL